jgi:hypothetical protein
MPNAEWVGVQKLRHLNDVAGEEKQCLSFIAGSHPAKKGIWRAAALAAPYTLSRT